MKGDRKGWLLDQAHKQVRQSPDSSREKMALMRMILHCYRKRMIFTFFIRICGSTSKHHTSSHRTCKYDIIHYKGFFQSSFLQETRWIPPGDQPTCSSSAANFVAPWKSTAPNPPRHRREWFECRCCRWPSHCPRQGQTLQLRQIDFAFSASRGGNHKKHTLGCIDQRTKDFILHFHCIRDIPRLHKKYSTHPLSLLSQYEFSIHHYSRSIIRMSSGHFWLSWCFRPESPAISSHCCWVAGST